MNRRPGELALILSVATLISIPRAALSQAEGDTLTGVITLGDMPIPNVEILLDETTRTESDSSGAFRLPVPAERPVQIDIRHSYFGRRDTVLIPDQDGLELNWSIKGPRYRLQDLRVSVKDPALRGTGFYKRRSDDAGGYFMTRDSLDLSRYENKPVEQILKASPQALFRDVLSGCTVLYVDGSHITSPGFKRWALYELAQGELAGIEVLAPGEAPLDFQ